MLLTQNKNKNKNYIIATLSIIMRMSLTCFTKINKIESLTEWANNTLMTKIQATLYYIYKLCYYS